MSLLFLLLTLPEFLFNPTFYFSCFTAGFAIFAYFHKLYLDRLKTESEAAKKERDLSKQEIDDLKKKQIQIENVQSQGYPRLTSLEAEFKHLHDKVVIYQESRIEGIVKDSERTRDIFTLKFDNHDKDIREIKDCISKLEEKFDRNTDKILDQIAKLAK
jgi:hypothetical protein